MEQTAQLNRREHDRLPMSAMYTSIAARRSEQEPVLWFEGHAYDISEGGVRIELDEPLRPGDQVSMRIGLPGVSNELCADGDVVWVNDAIDDPGPRRMALRFREFDSENDRQRLVRYIKSSLRSAAA